MIGSPNVNARYTNKTCDVLCCSASEVMVVRSGINDCRVLISRTRVVREWCACVYGLFFFYGARGLVKQACSFAGDDLPPLILTPFTVH